MKKILLLNVLLLLFALGTEAQSNYVVVDDTVNVGEKILKGIITKSDIENNPAYGWYAESRKIYPVPNAAAVQGMQKNKDNVNIVIFAGTWCEDSHFILPKFFKIQEASGFPENRITIYAVDRTKHTAGNATEDYHITSTPTIIVMKDGREVGRLVEYGKSGVWDKEFAAIFSE